MNAAIIRRTILGELAASQPYQVVQATLHLCCNQRIPDLALADLVGHLGQLRDDGLVDFVPDPLSPEDSKIRRWFITTRGQAALKQ